MTNISSCGVEDSRSSAFASFAIFCNKKSNLRDLCVLGRRSPCFIDYFLCMPGEVCSVVNCFFLLPLPFAPLRLCVRFLLFVLCALLWLGRRNGSLNKSWH